MGNIKAYANKLIKINRFIYNTKYICYCLSQDKILSDKEKNEVVALKSKKRSGRRLEFMEIIRKDDCFILQHYVFKSISSNLK